MDAGVSRAQLLNLAQPGSIRGKPGARALTPLGRLGLLSFMSAHFSATFWVALGSSRYFGKVLNPTHQAGEWTRLKQVTWKPLLPSGALAEGVLRCGRGGMG